MASFTPPTYCSTYASDIGVGVDAQRSASEDATPVLVQRDPPLEFPLAALRVPRAPCGALELAACNIGRDVSIVSTNHVPDPGFVVDEDRSGVTDEVFAGDAKTVKDRE